MKIKKEMILSKYNEGREQFKAKNESLTISIAMCTLFSDNIFIMEFKKGEIEGVIIEKSTKFSDERGFLFETFRIDNLPDNLHPVMSYISYSKPGVARGPHEHLKQTDIFCFIGPGNFKIKLWDNRKESKTYGYYMEVIGGEDNPIRIIVPPGVVHGYRNISREVMGMVLNYPDKLYRGWTRKEEVDEIRHEDEEDEFYLDFIKEDE